LVEVFGWFGRVFADDRVRGKSVGDSGRQGHWNGSRDADIIACGAGAGAVIGAIAMVRGAGIGAVTGGGVGTGVVLATKGKEIQYGLETRLNFILVNSVEI
jgi:hypothetical protein